MGVFGSRIRKKDDDGYGGEGYYCEADDSDGGDYERDRGGKAGGNEVEFDDLKFSEDKDTIITCKVPPKLKRVTVTMDA